MAPTQAASGFIRAGMHPEAGSEEIQNESYGAVGTTPDYIATGEDTPNVVASDSYVQEGGRAEGVVATPEGGAGVISQYADIVDGGPAAIRVTSMTDGTSDPDSNSDGGVTGTDSDSDESGPDDTQNSIPRVVRVFTSGPDGQGGGSGMMYALLALVVLGGLYAAGRGS
ncbi:hypothetical protein [Halosimplex halobium]|uniref:hypothetical protein n=1 Tax=Halosimplex halobium TaxID=3396618 RepID=UPI003F56E2D3